MNLSTISNNTSVICSKIIYFILCVWPILDRLGNSLKVVVDFSIFQYYYSVSRHCRRTFDANSGHSSGQYTNQGPVGAHNHNWGKKIKIKAILDLLQKVESYDNQNFSIAKSPLKMPIERLGSEDSNFFIKVSWTKKNIDIRYSQETQCSFRRLLINLHARFGDIWICINNICNFIVIFLGEAITLVTLRTKICDVIWQFSENLGPLQARA